MIRTSRKVEVKPFLGGRLQGANITMGVKQIRKNCQHEYDYEKFVYEQPNVKPIYSYKKVCKKCGSAKSVKMTSEIFEIVKYKPWHKSVKEIR